MENMGNTARHHYIACTLHEVSNADTHSHTFLGSSERGIEKHVELDGLSASDIEKKVTDLLSASAP